jgi:DNA (cytosine-5)-methyltransferase 1
VNVLSLFSGIGGLDLGLERAGMQVVGQVEIDPFCRAVLDSRWPEVPRHDDVRTAAGWWAAGERPAVHVVAGGFPCQPFSTAGRQRGVGDPRWGWPWLFDVVRRVRPRYVLVENVAALVTDVRFADVFGRILGDLASPGFAAEWSVLSACALGAPHVRQRLFLVAYPDRVDGQVRVGHPQGLQAAVEPVDVPAGAWTDPVDGLMAAARRGRRVADGAARRLEPARVRALGNAVVPAVAEHVGRLIVRHAVTTTTEVNR